MPTEVEKIKSNEKESKSRIKKISKKGKKRQDEKREYKESDVVG